ncbi:MAG TPA: hypothetical protein VEN28_05480, partial [Burkholderiaceae bacterium]|nr:hypothetical protein [Burkholderiaceae bacterium]
MRLWPAVALSLGGARANPERAVQCGIEGLATPMIGRDAELQRRRSVAPCGGLTRASRAPRRRFQQELLLQSHAVGVVRDRR